MKVPTSACCSALGCAAGIRRRALGTAAGLCGCALGLIGADACDVLCLQCCGWFASRYLCNHLTLRSQCLELHMVDCKLST